ncbi:hypothetical protein [Herbidospora sp. RD11066]
MVADPPTLDPHLSAGLGPESAATLAAWARQKRLRYDFEGWFLNGRSGSVVALVREVHALGARKLVLKLFTTAGDDYDGTEYPRHQAAVNEAPKKWKRRLADIAHDPVPVRVTGSGDHLWIFFQEIASGSLENYNTLTFLLSTFLKPGPGHPICDADTFVATCRLIVEGVLAGWAVSATHDPLRPRDTVPEFLVRHVGSRFDVPPDWLGGDQRTPILVFDDEPHPLPNPFSLLWDPSATVDITVPALLGRAHGDLESQNILVRVDRVEPGDFFLTDLANYESRAPLTRDPVHLVLSLVTQALPELSASQRSALIDLLLDPASGTGSDVLLPGWLRKLVLEVHGAASRWLHRKGYEGDWRRQTLLSTVACSLIFLQRDLPREEDRTWFLRLAARATQAFLHQAGHSSTTAHLPLPQPPPLSERRSRAWVAHSIAVVTGLMTVATVALTRRNGYQGSVGAVAGGIFWASAFLVSAAWSLMESRRIGRSIGPALVTTVIVMAGTPITAAAFSDWQPPAELAPKPPPTTAEIRRIPLPTVVKEPESNRDLGQITYPPDNAEVPHGMLSVSGIADPLKEGHTLWLFLHVTAERKYYAADPPGYPGELRFTDGIWTANVFVGGRFKKGERFELILVDLSPAATDTLYNSGERLDHGFPFLRFAEGITVIDRISIVGV